MTINVFTFTGNIGKDMEVRYTPNAKTIGEVSVACKSGFGEHEKTSWIRCKLFGERAGKLAPYLTKGKAVTVTGEFTLEEWEKDGVKHSMACVAVRDIQLPPKSDSPQQNSKQPPASAPPADGGGFDDDIPF